MLVWNQCEQLEVGWAKSQKHRLAGPLTSGIQLYGNTRRKRHASLGAIQ